MHTCVAIISKAQQKESLLQICYTVGFNLVKLVANYLILLAGDGTRTRDLLITNQLLYQLSYASVWKEW